MKATSYLSEDDLRQIQLLADDLERSQIEAARAVLGNVSNWIQSDAHLDAADTEADMRAVVIVEFWAMMAGGLPFGWRVCASRHYGGFVYASGPGWESVPSRQTCADMWWGDVWAMEYAERPRLEGSE